MSSVESKYRIFIIAFLFFLIAASSNAQRFNYRFMDIKGHTGFHLYSGDDLNKFLNNYYGALEVRFGWQMDGGCGWEHNYRYPAFGLGWYSGFVGNSKIIGNPNAVYGFVSFPISRLKRNVWISEAALGLTYDLHKYDAVKNPSNDAIGASLAVYFNYSIGGRYAYNREIDLLYALDLTHMSNGRMSQPNHGLNMVGINLGVRYHFNRLQRKNNPGNRPDIIWDVRPDYVKDPDVDMRSYRENNFLIYTAAGFSQNLEDKGTSLRYFNASGVLEYQRFFHLKHAAVVGVDFFYDGNMLGYDQDPHELGYHLGYDYRIWKCTLRLQAGGYIYAPDRKGDFFMRPAIKYDISKRWYTQVSLKTRSGIVADWMEWGIGIKL